MPYFVGLRLISAMIRRVRQFLFYAKAYGLRPALRRAGLFFRYQINLFIKKLAGKSYGYMSWAEFESSFLSRRDIYKGIFIQNSTIIWNDNLFQRPQQMALALGRLGYLVIYKTPNVVADEVVGVRNIAPNVYLTSRESFDFLEGAVHSVYSTDFFQSLNWEKNRSSFCMIYEYIDQIDPKISGRKNVRRLIAHKKIAFGENRYDFIIASARQLEEEAVDAVGRDKVLLVSNGVDPWHYRNPSHKYITLPEKMLDFRRKYKDLIGYFGAIAPWLWYDELAKLMETRPDLGFVFIGPDYDNAARKLPQRDNMLWLDKIEYGILPAYAIQFDVCFIPFEPGEIAKTTSPLKLFEYFALEKPIVVTSQMYECTAFDVVFSGDDAESLSMAIDKAIGFKSDRAFKNKLARLADENSWDNRARSLENIFPKAPTISDLPPL